MAYYSDLVIQDIEDSEYMKTAGFHTAWNRSMVISDYEIPFEIKGKIVSLVCPAGALPEEVMLIRKKAESKHVQVNKMINEPLAVTEFYVDQNGLSETEKNIIVICSHYRYTDICQVSFNRRNGTIRDTHRLDHVDLCEELSFLTRRRQKRSKDQLGYVNQVIREIKRKIFCMKNDSHIVIILSGRIWLNQTYVQAVKERFDESQVLAYKPEATAILGAVQYAKRYHQNHVMASVDDDYVAIHYRDFYGEVNILTAIQQNSYWKILNAVMKEAKEVVFEGNGNDLRKIYMALRIDCPEMCIIWDYENSTYWEQIERGKPIVRMQIAYKEGGRSLLHHIEKKAETILLNCIRNVGNQSDPEIIRKLYLYMADNYHYSEEKDENGNFPKYAYTLETLLNNGVCHGYAISMIFMLHKLQIPIMYVGGDADGVNFGGHAWNMIQQLDGSFRHLDITWDLGKGRIPSRMKHYVLDDIAMKSRRHFWCVRDYPLCV